jgi:hypothetical protein
VIAKYGGSQILLCVYPGTKRNLSRISLASWLSNCHAATFGHPSPFSVAPICECNMHTTIQWTYKRLLQLQYDTTVPQFRKRSHGRVVLFYTSLSGGCWCNVFLFSSREGHTAWVLTGWAPKRDWDCGIHLVVSACMAGRRPAPRPEPFFPGGAPGRTLTRMLWIREITAAIGLWTDSCGIVRALRGIYVNEICVTKDFHLLKYKLGLV